VGDRRNGGWHAPGQGHPARSQPGLGGNNPDPYGLTAVGNDVYFVAVDTSDSDGGATTHDYALWKSDGTEAGTVIVKNIWVGAGNDPGIAHLTAVNGKLFFTGNDGINGNELWVTDGTEPGSVRLTDRSGNLPSDPHNLFNAHGTLLFSAIDANGAGVELMKSDGTVSGTVLLKDINAGGFDSDPANFVDAGGFTYFTADDGVHGRALWRTDGTSVGTVMASPVNPIGPIVAVNGSLYFTANDGSHGSELWRWDAVQGATMVADLQPGDGSSNPTNLTNVGGTLYFIANNELWKSDGSIDGTVALSPAVIGPIASLHAASPVNNAPTSADGSTSINEDTSIAGLALPAATDIDGDSVAYAPGSTDVLHGSVTVHANGTFDYTPAPNFNGTDAFSFVVSDGHGGANEYTYTLTINPVNDLPTIMSNGAGNTAGVSREHHLGGYRGGD
jgi:ELWxxDGT repeat protein